MKTSLFYLLVVIAVVSASVIPEGQREKRGIFSCNNRCRNGGCRGVAWTRCWGACYCIGSGYEYRCNYCDL